MEKEVSFFEVETWAKLAEACNNLGKKGRGVRVVGRLKQDRWTGNDGKQRSKISIVAEHVEFRPEFRKEAASESPPEPVENAAALAAASAISDDAADYTPVMEDDGVPVMTDVLEAVTF